MSLSTEPRAESPAQQTFESLNPATGEVVGTFPVNSPDEVAAAVTRAREAATWWQGIGYDGRRRHLRALARVLVRRRDELLDIIHRENGKPVVDAWIEHTLTLEHIDFAAKRAEKVLGPQKMPGSRKLFNQAAQVEYQPMGVVGVIGPWNYPLFTPMGSIVYALGAGNAVVFKPSEYTPAVGKFLESAMREAVPEQPVFQVVTGFGETGAALCRSGVDKVAFTGSASTGRKIMAACAETLTPVLLELGGKDALIVDDDADVVKAARAAVWGACSNAGQTCIGIERVYATEKVYDRFLDEVVRQARDVKAQKGDIGPITMPKQLDVIAAHIQDAIERGARALVGGPESVHAPYVDPVVLVDVPEDAAVMREETFGPVLPVTRVRDGDEAIARANATTYGLGAAVFSKARGVELARRIRSGMASVNSVLAFAGFAAVPFGGVGESGFGRIHGADGLKEFTRPKAIVRERFPLPFDLTVFDRPGWLPKVVQKMDELRYGRG